MVLSIICATIGPYYEVCVLLKSVIKAIECSKISRVEFILVDQSDAKEERGFPFHDRLKLIHIRNISKGLSLNRNIGLLNVTGDWVMFVDSDCVIADDYFKNLLILNNKYPEVEHFLGKVVVSDSNLPLFRKWPSKEFKIQRWMMWYLATSVNSIFVNKKDGIKFDESFGLGAKYGSCEDIDYHLRMPRVHFYSHKLVVLHPYVDINNVEVEKLNSYSYGFGALCAKHVFPLGFFMLIASFLKKILDVVRGRAKYDNFKNAVIFRSLGFVAFLSNRKENGHG